MALRFALLRSQTKLPAPGVVSRSARLAFGVVRVAILSLRASVEQCPRFGLKAARALLDRRIPVGACVFSDVRRLIRVEFKILHAVVQRVAVSVMNALLGLQHSAECLFHYQAMLGYPVPLDSEQTITRSADRATSIEGASLARPSLTVASEGTVFLCAGFTASARWCVLAFAPFACLRFHDFHGITGWHSCQHKGDSPSR